MSDDYKVGDKVVSLRSYGNQLTKGKEYRVESVTNQYLRVITDEGRIDGWDRTTFKRAEPQPDPLAGCYVIVANDFDPKKHERQRLGSRETYWTNDELSCYDADKPIVVRDKPQRIFVTIGQSQPQDRWRFDDRLATYLEDMGDGTYRRLSDEEVKELQEANRG